MAVVIEEQMKQCNNCGKTTKHFRNNSKSSGFMIAVHILLTLFTLGGWLLVIGIWKILNFKMGGWKCGECA